MTKLLEMAIEAAGHLSPEEQDDIARTIFDIIEVGAEPYVLSEEDNAAIKRSREAIERGEFATDEQVKAVLAKYSRWRLGSW
jgi:predicted transcriptional regulator